MEGRPKSNNKNSIEIIDRIRSQIVLRQNLLIKHLDLNRTRIDRGPSENRSGLNVTQYDQFPDLETPNQWGKVCYKRRAEWNRNDGTRSRPYTSFDELRAL